MEKIKNELMNPDSQTLKNRIIPDKPLNPVKMLFFALVFTSFAAQAQVCEIAETGATYATFDDALNDALTADNQTIRLLANINHTSTVTISNKTLTLETNGFTLDITAVDYGLSVSGGKLILDDSGGGEFNVTATTGGIQQDQIGVTVGGSGSEATVTNATGHKEGARASSGGSITVKNDAIATGPYSTGAQATNGGSVIIEGNAQGVDFGALVFEANITVMGDVIGSTNGIGAKASGISGNILVEGNARGGSTGAYADQGGRVTVTLDAIGTYGVGAFAQGTGTVIIIEGNAEGYITGACTYSGSSITVMKDAIGTGPAGTGAYAGSVGSEIIVEGNAQGGEYGAQAFSESRVTVKKDAIGANVCGASVYGPNAAVIIEGNAQGEALGVTAGNGGSVTVYQNVTATGMIGIGAYTINNGTVTIDGTLTGHIYISFTTTGPSSTTDKTAAEFTTPTTKADYLTYTSGTATVWVKGTAPITDISDATVTQSGTLTYDGTAQTPAFDVSLDGGLTYLTENTDYTLNVTAQTGAGDNYTATITGTGNYQGTANGTWSIDRANQTTPVITGGNISKVYGDADFTVAVSGGESTGAYSYSSSNADVAATGANGRVTLGTGANAIGSTTLSVKKLGDSNYNDSGDATATLTVDKAPQTPPTIHFNKSGDPATTGVTVTVTSPATGATYSTDGLTYSAVNPVLFPPGVVSATVYVKLDATAVYLESPPASVWIDFALASQAAPPAFTMTGIYHSGSGDYTVTIPEENGADYSFNGTAWSSTRTAAAAPGTTVTGYMRYPASATHNASPATTSTLTLPVPATGITVTGAGGATAITSSGGKLQMSADITPFNTTNPAVVWSVTNGTGSASISAGGLLTAISNGTVTVRATAADGFGAESAPAVITISGQASPAYSISVSTLTAFGPLQTPYTQPAAQTVTVTGTGTGVITLAQPAASNYDIGTLSTTTLAVNGATATFTVQPKAGLTEGNHDEIITVSGNSGTVTATVSASFTVTDASVPAPPSITTSFLPAGTTGTAYSQSLAATGGAPVTWTVDSGSLPDGLSLSGAGAVTGTPTAAGLFDFSVKASNGAGSDTRALSITITDPSANEAIAQPALTARVENGVLHIGGLIQGRTWSVYNLHGQLVYRNVAAGSRAELRLSERGIYILVSGKRSIKTVN
jgi:hypothetical protein